MVTFPDAIKTCLSKYVVFSGRARRSEYWFFYLFTVLISIAASILDAVFGLNDLFSSGTEYSYSSGPISAVAGLALLLPSLAAAWRRLHDTGRSGLWVLISLIPCVGWIILLVFLVQDSHPDNQYGPSPKYPSTPAPPHGDTWR